MWNEESFLPSGRLQLYDKITLWCLLGPPDPSGGCTHAFSGILAQPFFSLLPRLPPAPVGQLRPLLMLTVSLTQAHAPSSPWLCVHMAQWLHVGTVLWCTLLVGSGGQRACETLVQIDTLA
jgi:hypothetical protein